jgi:hypothetical protein
MATPGALANVDTNDLIERIYNGDIPARIATELGVTKAAVYYHVGEHPEYQRARRIGMAIRLDEAEIGIVDSPDQLTLSRAREQFRAVAWRAEREHPDVWGQKQQAIQINVLSVTSALGSLAGDLLGQLNVAAQLPQCNMVHNEIADAQVVDSDTD